MKTVQFLYYLGALALLAGAVSRMFLPEYYSYIYIAGAVVFAVAQFLLRPRHKHFMVRRLVVQQQIGAILLVAAGVLMFVLHNNEWVAVMFAGALMELYTAFRIPAEIEKQQ
ncbi:MAG: hypothetical protein IKV19_05405 [Bacteroidaceae bacterium]|nr:hypothetical protein [Bacteroidaceae bacterium]